MTDYLPFLLKKFAYDFFFYTILALPKKCIRKRRKNLIRFYLQDALKPSPK